MGLVIKVSNISELEEEAVGRILALPGEPYTLGKGKGRIVGKWKEAEEALIVAGEAHARGHLAFNVFAESGRNTGRARDRDIVRTQADLVVLFMFRIRSTNQIADARLASLASRDVVSALLAMPQAYVVYDVVNSWRPNTVGGGDWLLVRMDFTADFDLSTIPRST